MLEIPVSALAAGALCDRVPAISMRMLSRGSADGREGETMARDTPESEWPYLGMRNVKMRTPVTVIQGYLRMLGRNGSPNDSDR